MKDRYLLLRFIAFYLYFSNKLNKNNSVKDGKYQYNGDIDELLGLTMDYLNSLDDCEINNIKDIVLKGLKQISFYVGENAFRLIDVMPDGRIKRYPININIFETLLYGMVNVPFEKKEIREVLVKKINELKNDETFRDSLNNHRDSDAKVKYRYNAIMKIVGEICDK